MLDGEIDRINRETRELGEERRTLSKAIEELTARLAGTIACPNCNYEFLVSDKTFDVAQATADLEEKNATFESITSQIAGCETKIGVIEKEDGKSARINALCPPKTASGMKNWSKLSGKSIRLQTNWKRYVPTKKRKSLYFFFVECPSRNMQTSIRRGF